MMNFNISKYDLLESTNIKAKEIAENVEEGRVIVAKEQSAGKGRLGRSWTSTKDKGLWMSIILKPSIPLRDIPKIGLLVSAVVHKSLEDMGIKTSIKWPNDIILEGKKICGILIEVDGNMDRLNHVIVGIGLNISQDMEDFPEDIRLKAGSIKMLTSKELNIDILLDKILHNFSNFYKLFIDKGDIDYVLEVNKCNSILIGKEVYLIKSEGERRKGLALDINNQGELIVKFPEGIEKVYGGEVSVRGLKGYI